MILSLLKEQPLAAIVYILAIVLSLSIHEFSHALIGYLQGDHTAEYEGRLTLNPLAHIDWVGMFTLLFFGFGWGKPVPYNPYNLRYRRWGPVLVAIAGPISNFLFFLLAAVGYKIATAALHLGPDNLLVLFFLLLGFINVGLMIFNLIPIPPLDGSRLLDVLLPDRYYELKGKIFQYGPTVLLVLVFMNIALNISVFGWLGDVIQKIVFAVF